MRIAVALLAALAPADALCEEGMPFSLPPGFEIQRVAAEPDIANPMTLCVDEQGTLWASEAHTYRWGPEGSPFQPPGNPIKRIEVGPDGRAERVTVAAAGFPEPVIGIHARKGKLYATSLNELFVMDIAPDGRLENRRLLVKDAAAPWNPFGMYRVQAGPDDKLWLCIADHPATEPVTLTGSDGRVVRLRGQSGGLVRCNLDGSGLEILVHGFRAPYAFDVDPWGHLWHISNGEGSPNIYAHVIPGFDYGYATRTVTYDWMAGRETFSPPVTYMGTGANTAALHYYSSMFPPEYWGSIFIANWGSHGANPPDREIRRFVRQRNGRDIAGSSDAGLVEVEKFLTTTDPMFRPTAMVLAQDGGMYVSDWHGRDDENSRRGRIYKIVHAALEVRAARTGDKDASRDPPEIPEGSPDRLARLLGHSNHWVRELARRGLVEAGDDAVEPLGEVAERGDPLAAAYAVWALTRLDSAKAAEALTRAVRHSDPRIRAHAFRQSRQFAGHTLGGDGLGVLQPGAPSDPPRLNPETLAGIAATLLEDPDAEARVEAALALNSPEAVARGLLAALETAGNPRLRYQIGFELGRRGNEAALHHLRHSPDPEWQRVGWIAVETARHEQSPLARAVHDWEIPSTFEPTPNATSTDPAVPRFETDPSHARRLEEVYALGLNGGKADVAQWRLWLLDDSSELVTAALRALRQMPHPPELINLVRDLAGELESRHAMLGEEAAFTLDRLEMRLPSDLNLDELEAEILRRLPNASALLGRFAFGSPPGNCSYCHATRPGEMRFGPSLAGIGASPAQYLVESILQPSKVIKTGFQTEIIEVSDGRVLSGLVEARGDQLIVRAGLDEKEMVRLDQIESRTASPVSPMPEGSEHIMSLAELADLTAFLLSLKETN